MAALFEPFAAVLEVVADVGMTAAHNSRTSWRTWAKAVFWTIVVAMLLAIPFAILLAYGAPIDSRTWW